LGLLAPGELLASGVPVGGDRFPALLGLLHHDLEGLGVGELAGLGPGDLLGADGREDHAQGGHAHLLTGAHRRGEVGPEGGLEGVVAHGVIVQGPPPPEPFCEDDRVTTSSLPARLLASTAAAGVAALAWGTLVEPRLFALRRHTLPVLAPGSEPV